jgi:regulator of cell morphogenesis and NO signaling
MIRKSIDNAVILQKKQMQEIDLSNKSVADIVKSDYRTAAIFKQYGINYCCGGQLSLLEACMVKGIDYKNLQEKLSNATRNIYINNALQFANWKIDFLIDYIINVHHAYLDETIPALKSAMFSFIEGHKKKFPELEKLFMSFTELSNILLLQNKHEEEVIFPYIKQLESTHRRKEVYGNLFVRTLRKPLSSLEKENNIIRKLLAEMEACANDFQFPSNACTSHQVIYHRLKEFHDDLVQHKHLEKNILYPRAVDLEKELLQL